MADDGNYPAIVDCVVGLHVEEGRLQYRGRKHDFIHQRVVVGVDRLRRHAPFAAIDGLAELVEIAPVLELIGTHHVAPKIIA